MNQRQLTYFLEVYKQRSVAAASEALYISPQALSKTIISLEEEIGVKLFERSGKKMLPTNAAINLTSHAKNILDEYNVIEKKDFLTHSPHKTLVVLSCYDAARYFPAHFYYEFHRQYPEILLHITELPDYELLSSLDQNKAELALASGPLDVEKYDVKLLFTSPFLFIMNKEHPLAKKKSISLSDLTDQPLVIKGQISPISNSQMNHFLSHQVNPSILLEVSDYHVIHEMAAENYAIGMTLDYLVKENLPENVVVRPCSAKSLIKSVFLTHRQGISLSNEGACFQNFVVNWMNSAI